MAIPGISGYTEPGVYVREVKVPRPPATGLPIWLLLIGKGKTENTVLSEKSTMKDEKALHPSEVDMVYLKEKGLKKILSVKNFVGDDLKEGVDWNYVAFVDAEEIILLDEQKIGIMSDEHQNLTTVAVKSEDGTITYVEGTDYAINREYGRILWKGATPPSKIKIISSGNLSKLQWVAGKVPADDLPFYISYSYNRPLTEYKECKEFYSVGELENEMGDGDDPEVKYPLALAANIAFENGAPFIKCMQINPVSDYFYPGSYAYEEALDNLRGENLQIIVPLLAITNESADEIGKAFRPKIKNHILQMSSIAERKERIAILGAPIGTEVDLNIYKNAANYFKDSDRFVYLCPSTGIRYIKGEPVMLDGSFLAAAVGGLLAATPSYAPLLRKRLAGFSDIKDHFLRTELNQLASNGVCIIESQMGALRLRHPLTTRPYAEGAPADEQEIQIRRAKDYHITTMRMLLEEMFIGAAATAETIASMAAFCKVLFSMYIAEGSAAEFSNLQIVQDTDEPRQIDVSYKFRPIWTIVWIYVNFQTEI